MSPQSLSVDESKLTDTSAYPVKVVLHKLPAPKEWANRDVKSGLYRSNLFAVEEPLANDNVSAQDEIVHCKYVVGCDGARSWVRRYVEIRIIYRRLNADSQGRQMGLELKGDSANVYWGAFDAIIKSDVRT